ncbi:MAG: DJ-1/PfpI family protein [Candidatus Peribacteria bacterium]|nr:DJ-1/PfpI family protein [Candidatus Peribacteria bacterium]
MFGTHLPTSLSFDEVKAEHYDALVFVGGGGAYEEYVHDERYITLGRQAKLLCAICIAPTLLAPSGRLKGKEVTGRDDGNGTEIKYLEAHGAKFIGGEVVRDEEVITANGPQASVAFGWKIIEALEQTTIYH